MHEFDTYISTIIDGLKISEKKKGELFEEFKDHLVSLKSEFIKGGLSEAESIEKAIERFGNTNIIKKKLNKSLFDFRKSATILFGIAITLIIIIFSYIPVAGTMMAFHKYSSISNVPRPPFVNSWQNLIYSVLFFVPIGYFLPIILNKAYKVYQFALVFSIFGILIGVCFNIALTHSVNTGFVLAYLASGLIGGMLGYAVLTAINKLNMVRKNARGTKPV